jgi:hypothetical protein
VAGAADANEALDLLAEGGADALTEERCGEIMAAALERDNPALAQAVFRAMTAAAAASGGAPAPAAAASRALAWPPAADTATAASLVVGLARALRTKDAVAVVHSVRSRGLPTSEDVQFGFVVGCPLAQDKPLAVVQPQQGVQQVADSFTRYEYELYSGAVASAGSEALGGGGGGWAAAAARTLGLLRRPAAGAVHALLVETPGGQQRSFRFATATPDVPAKVGDRVTVVCAPQTAVFSRRRLLSAAPPGSKPGEALSLSNHTTRAAAPLLRPPAPGAAGGGLPAWALPAAAALAASDAATSLIDPALPFLVTGALAAAAASAVAGSTLLLPRLKQLPDRVVDLAATRQRLLGQHSALERRVGYLVDECSEDVRALARLWQLQTKMGAVAAGGAYGARLERVAAARRAVEARLAARVGAVDAYARVISMIEIEVEMETEVPLAEVQGACAERERETGRGGGLRGAGGARPCESGGCGGADAVRARVCRYRGPDRAAGGAGGAAGGVADPGRGAGRGGAPASVHRRVGPLSLGAERRGGWGWGWGWGGWGAPGRAGPAQGARHERGECRGDELFREKCEKLSVSKT